MNKKRSFDADDLTMDLRKQLLGYLQQPELCESFYSYMKSEQLPHVLEFYLACDGLKTMFNDRKRPDTIIELIYKHYLSRPGLLSDDLLSSIQQRLIKRDFHRTFYDQAQEYVLRYMLQMCFPKFLIERQQHLPATKRQAIGTSTFTPMHRRHLATRKKETPLATFDLSDHFSLKPSNDLGLKANKAKPQTSLAEQNPTAFFQEIRSRLLIQQSADRFASHGDNRLIEDDSFAVLDQQIAKTIDDADHCLHSARRSDSGMGTDTSQKTWQSARSIDVVWYPSLYSQHTLLSTVRHTRPDLTFREFRQLFKKQPMYRYFFKTTCTPDINKDQFVFRELTMDDELVPFFDGKIFLQLDCSF